MPVAVALVRKLTFSTSTYSCSFLIGGKGLVEPVKEDDSFRRVLLEIISNQDKDPSGFACGGRSVRVTLSPIFHQQIPH